ncbi:sensor histidine kinase [Streptomyces sp. NPDC088762]|uniref:sensor histidine kinase n=1 Tax=Streptomyces sp. NPDC088762 TaxID=3365891 RepID=UPI0037F438AA
MRFPHAAQTAVVVAVSAAEIGTVWGESGPWDLALYGFSLGVVLVCRRYPVPALLATLPVAYTGYLVLAPMFAMYQVAVAARSRKVTLTCAVLLFAATLAYWTSAELPEDWTPEYGLMGLVSAALGSAGPTALGSLVRAKGELSTHIAALVAAQERERLLLARTAVAEERARLARDMHDSVSYHVSLITVRAGAWERTADQPESREAAATIRQLGAATMTELRRLVGVLKEAPGGAGGRVGLREVPALIEESGLDVSADLGRVLAREWPPAVQEAAYRIVQEALTNVLKHAPGSTTAVTLAPARGPAADGLLVEVRSRMPVPSARKGAAGREPEPLPGGGHGLAGLRERARSLGGSLEAGPTADGGFLVRATLPCPVA